LFEIDGRRSLNLHVLRARSDGLLDPDVELVLLAVLVCEEVVQGMEVVLVDREAPDQLLFFGAR
jgi:hypothetical protein